MPRIVPSRISEFIGQTIQKKEEYNVAELEGQIGALASIVAMFDSLADNLITLQSDEYATLVSGIETLRMGLDKMRTGGLYDQLKPATRCLPSIWKLIAKLPDSVPTRATDLRFINDAVLRNLIAADIEAVRIAVENAEWKGATIIAGSCNEALLLYGLQRAEKKNSGTLSAVSAKVTWNGVAPPLTNLTDRRWDLASYALLAEKVGLITSNTYAEVNVGRDYRNLIHPAKIIRESTPFDRGTALVGAGSIEHVVRDLKKYLK